jgi:hypothetical protein
MSARKKTTGRPRQIEIEIGFVAADGKYYVLAEHHRRAQWVPAQPAS